MTQDGTDIEEDALDEPASNLNPHSNTFISQVPQFVPNHNHSPFKPFINQDTFQSDYKTEFPDQECELFCNEKIQRPNIFRMDEPYTSASPLQMHSALSLNALLKCSQPTMLKRSDSPF